MKRAFLGLDMMRDWPIRQKLMMVIMLICTVVLLINCLLLGFYQIYKFAESLKDKATVLADVLAENTQAALSFHDENAAEQTLKSLQVDSYVTAACLYNEKNVAVATYVKAGSQPVIPHQPGPDGAHFKASGLVVLRQVTLNGKRIGTIYLSYSLQGLYDYLRLFGVFAVFVFIASGLAAYVLTYILQRPISQPIQTLTDIARRISVDKDFTVRAIPHGRDELGLLTGALNELLKSIEERDSALRAANELLRNEVAERKEAEHALAKSEQRLKALMQALPVGVSFSTDATCQVINGNSALQAQLEAAQNDNVSPLAPDAAAYGRMLKFFRDGIAVTPDQLPLQRAVAESREIKPSEFEVVLPSGRRKFVEASGAPIFDSEGDVIAGVAVTVDISERKRVQDALREAHAQLAEKALQLEELVEQRTAKLTETIGELEAFSYSIAHDLRAPLRSLQGFSDILLAEYADKLDEGAQEHLQRIVKSAARMDRLILDVLNYSSVVRSEFPMTVIDVVPLLQGILESYPMFASDKADISIETPLPSIQGNEAMLTQVFSNLIGNAIKFVAPGIRPCLKIWGETRAAIVRIFVQDNGIGIAPDQCEKIFAIFQRVSKRYEGTGIGLAIVRKAAERMGGKVGVQSTPGQGSTFWIELKRAN
jgi:signal transduction histidine kinase